MVPALGRRAQFNLELVRAVLHRPPHRPCPAPPAGWPVRLLPALGRRAQFNLGLVRAVPHRPPHRSWPAPPADLPHPPPAVLWLSAALSAMRAPLI
eukprot:13772622-Alexandrium_andersonii.AAC.1